MPNPSTLMSPIARRLLRRDCTDDTPRLTAVRRRARLRTSLGSRCPRSSWHDSLHLALDLGRHRPESSRVPPPVNPWFTMQPSACRAAE